MNDTVRLDWLESRWREMGWLQFGAWDGERRVARIEDHLYVTRIRPDNTETIRAAIDTAMQSERAFDCSMKYDEATGRVELEAVALLVPYHAEGVPK